MFTKNRNQKDYYTQRINKRKKGSSIAALLNVNPQTHNWSDLTNAYQR